MVPAIRPIARRLAALLLVTTLAGCPRNRSAEDDLRKAADDWAEYDRKIDEGRKEGEKLTKRFGPWYYVIDQALFAKLKPERKDLVKPKAAATPANGAADAGHDPAK